MNERIQQSGTPMGLTIALAAIGIGIGVVFYATFGFAMFAYYAITVPVCLFMLWLSRDVPTWEQRHAHELEEHRPARVEPARSTATTVPAESHS